MLHARAVEDARIRARDGRAAGRALDREDRRALRAELLLPLGPPGAMAAWTRRGRATDEAKRRARPSALTLSARGGVCDTRRPRAPARRPARRRGCRGDAPCTRGGGERRHGDRGPERPFRGERVMVRLEAFPAAARRAL